MCVQSVSASQRRLEETSPKVFPPRKTLQNKPFRAPFFEGSRGTLNRCTKRLLQDSALFASSGPLLRWRDEHFTARITGSLEKFGNLQGGKANELPLENAILCIL